MEREAKSNVAARNKVTMKPKLILGLALVLNGGLGWVIYKSGDITPPRSSCSLDISKPSSTSTPCSDEIKSA